MKYNGSRLRAYTVYVMWVPLVILGGFLYWPYKTVEMLNPFPVLTEIVQAGQPVKYRIVGEKFTNAQGWVGRRLVGRNSYSWEYVSASRKKGRYNEVSATTVIPAHIEPGRYRIEFSFSYKMNFLRTMTKHYWTEYFQVVTSDGDDGR